LNGLSPLSLLSLENGLSSLSRRGGLSLPSPLSRVNGLSSDLFLEKGFEESGLPNDFFLANGFPPEEEEPDFLGDFVPKPFLFMEDQN
jgi:hypothetical protein